MNIQTLCEQYLGKNPICLYSSRFSKINDQIDRLLKQTEELLKERQALEAELKQPGSDKVALRLLIAEIDAKLKKSDQLAKLFMTQLAQ